MDEKLVKNKKSEEISSEKMEYTIDKCKIVCYNGPP